MQRYIPVLVTLLLLLTAAMWRDTGTWKAAASLPRSAGSIPGYSCYRTLAELDAALLQTVNDHPQLVQLETIGASYESRPLQVARLTNIAIPGPKPILFLLANLHSREVITSEAAMKFIDYLTDAYGDDADATWLLDQHDIRVLVSANPDGHIQVDQGSAYSWWQKNTHINENCAPIGQYFYPGVDLAHNFNFHWFSGGNPCGESYRGYYDAFNDGVISEPETLAIQEYFSKIFRDFRLDRDTDPASENASGIFIDMQGPGERVVWPWSWSASPAPNSAALSLLGTKLSSLNGYTAQQASARGAAAGAVVDWPYGVLGTASFRFEIGPEAGGYYPACEQADDIIQVNLPALVYAAKVAHTPYLTSQGPDALDIKVEQAGQSWSVKAVISDSANGDNKVTAAEYYIDSYPWNGGTAYPLLADDGAFDAAIEPVSGPFPVTELSTGKHMILVRGKDSTGNWGPLSAIYFTVITDSTITGLVRASDSGLPIPAARCSFQGAEMSTQTETDGLGRYSAATLHGVYTATVTANGYSALVVPGIQVDTGQTKEQDFSLSPLPPNAGKLFLPVCFR